MHHANRLLILSLLLVITFIAASCQPPKPAPPVAEPLGPGSTVAISPDGKHLLVVRTLADSNEGWLVQTDGKASYKLFDFSSTYLFAAFSPDSRSLAWSTGELWLADLATSKSRAILGDEDNTTGALAWQPDGSELAVEQAGQLVRINLQGEVLSRVIAAESVRGLAWVKLDSGAEQLIYNSFPSEAPPFIAAVSLAGGENRRLAEGEVFAIAGDRLFYADPSAKGTLAVVDIIGETGKRILVEEGVTGLAPRPPAFDTVAYVLQTGDIGRDIWLISATGGTPTQLTGDAPVLAPLWSPDGKAIYYSAFRLDAPPEEDEPFSVFRLPVR